MKKLILSAILAAPVFAASSFQLSCDEVRTAACNMALDGVVSCSATDGFNTLSLPAENDNSCTLTNKLEEQICNAGLNPQTFVVDCVYRH